MNCHPINLLVCLGLLAALSACAGGRDLSPQAGDSDEAAALLPALSQLDAQAAEAAFGRSASAGSDLDIFLSAPPLLSSGTVDYIGSGYRLLASGTSPAWAVFHVPPTGLPNIDYSMNFAFAGTSSCYVAMANYSINRWVLKTQHEAQLDWAIPGRSEWVSPAGNSYFAVIAVDGGQVDVLSRVRRDYTGDPICSTIASLDSASELGLIQLGGRPALFYRENAADELRFIAASSSKPAGPADWAGVVVDDNPGSGIELSAGLLNTAPALAYTLDGNGGLRFAWGDTPSSPEQINWSSELVLSGGLYYEPCYLESYGPAGGVPVIAYFEHDMLDGDGDGVFGYYCIAVSEGSSPAGAWHSYRLLPSTSLPGASSLALINGQLWLAVASGSQPLLRLASAGSPAPDAAADWTVHETGINASRHCLQLHDNGGRPALSYLDGANGTSLYVAELDQNLTGDYSDNLLKIIAGPCLSSFGGRCRNGLLTCVYAAVGIGSVEIQVWRGLDQYNPAGNDYEYYDDSCDYSSGAFNEITVADMDGQTVAAWYDANNKRLRYLRLGWPGGFEDQL